MLQALDKPTANGTGRRGRPINCRHGYDYAAWGYVLYAQLHQSASSNIARDNVNGHAAPAESVEKKGMLGEEIREAPD